jgi:hypothetical protein
MRDISESYVFNSTPTHQNLARAEIANRLRVTKEWDDLPKATCADTLNLHQTNTRVGTMRRIELILYKKNIAPLGKSRLGLNEYIYLSQRVDV